MRSATLLYPVLRCACIALRARPVFIPCLRPSKLEPGLASRVGQGLDPAVIEKAVAIENHFTDSMLEASARDLFADRFGRRDIAFLLQIRGQLRAQRRSREQRASRFVRDDLRIYMMQRPIDREPRPCVAARDLAPDALAPGSTFFRLLGRHRRSVQLALAVAAALPALRRMVSVAYLIPLPLYGSGGRSSRIWAATCPISCRSALSRVITTWRSTLAVTPGGNW